ncbi:MAG: site-specific recombinase [bacterium]|nr:site-specific recombinase [bacterium]
MKETFYSILTGLLFLMAGWYEDWFVSLCYIAFAYMAMYGFAKEYHKNKKDND